MHVVPLRLGSRTQKHHIPPMKYEDARYPTAEVFELEARGALASIPAPLGEQLEGIALRIDEFASADQLAAVGIESRWNLTGLYEGRPISEVSIWESGTLPALISLFRQPLLREWEETGVGLRDLVRHVVIHEAGHHFGFSDDDMHALEDSVSD